MIQFRLVYAARLILGGEFFALSYDILFGGSLDVGVECADLSALEVSLLLPDFAVGVELCGEERAEISSPLSLVSVCGP